ncbi:MAG: cytochrome c maturation protein CcmE [Candidatus Binataceae bacterium]|nr:cytochrome c maturation protein CcmE [Candidatus Binataceae bacterium]
MSRKLRFVIGIAMVVAAIGYLITTAIQSTSEYYLTVNEVHARQNELRGQTVRVAGRVKPGTIRWDPDTLTLAFTMMALPAAESGGAVQPVSTSPPVYYDVISKGQPRPDMLADDRDVIVEGEIGSTNNLDARQVLTKCPSKYIPEKKG